MATASTTAWVLHELGLARRSGRRGVRVCTPAEETLMICPPFCGVSFAFRVEQRLQVLGHFAGGQPLNALQCELILTKICQEGFCIQTEWFHEERFRG